MTVSRDLPRPTAARETGEDGTRGRRRTPATPRTPGGGSTTKTRIGIDENGLGAQLGPLIVTAVQADVNESGARLLARKLSKRLTIDLDDSKKLMSFGNHALGEAWARALLPDARSPDTLLNALLREKPVELQARCPKSSLKQCWSVAEERFSAPEDLVNRLSKHLTHLRSRGVSIEAVCTEVVCVNQLNTERERGLNRFTSDLHAMERLTLHLHERAGRDVVAICGKVGGMADYCRFFGPLAGRLHVVLQQQRSHSAYRFPGLGEIHFMQDADAHDPLVMLASVVGKYVRETLMARVNGYYAKHIDELKRCSGYNDPISRGFIAQTAAVRKRLRILPGCFERA